MSLPDYPRSMAGNNLWSNDRLYARYCLFSPAKEVKRLGLGDQANTTS